MSSKFSRHTYVRTRAISPDIIYLSGRFSDNIIILCFQIFFTVFPFRNVLFRYLFRSCFIFLDIPFSIIFFSNFFVIKYITHNSILTNNKIMMHCSFTDMMKNLKKNLIQFKNKFNHKSKQV